MSARRLYLDACAVQRPLDRLLTSRERSEAECVLLLLEAVERGRLDLVWSPALTFETIRRGPPLRAEAAGRVRRLASHHVGLDDALVARARALSEEVGLQAFDALHLAAAQAAGATLVSVDGKLLRRGRRAGLTERALCDPIVAVTLLVS